MKFKNMFSKFWKLIVFGTFLNNENPLLSLCVTLRLKLKQRGHENNYRYYTMLNIFVANYLFTKHIFTYNNIVLHYVKKGRIIMVI